MAPGHDRLSNVESLGLDDSSVRVRDRNSKREGSCRIVQLYEDGKVILFIKGLKKTTSAQVVEQAMSSYGKILFVQLPYNKKKNKNIGYCYMVFENDDIARSLLNEKKPIEVLGRPVSVSSFKLRTISNKQEHQQVGIVVDDSFDQKAQFDWTIGGANTLVKNPSRSTVSSKEAKYNLNKYEHRTHALIDSFVIPSEHAAKPTLKKYHRQRERTAGVNHTNGNLTFRLPK